MQHAAACVTIGAVEMADLVVGIVHEYQRLQVPRVVADIPLQRLKLVRQKAYSKISEVRVESVRRHRTTLT